jgi:hypothetical protein
MQGHELFKNATVGVAMAHEAAGTTQQVGSTIDTYGYQGAAFVFLYGALTATQVTNAKLQGGNASNGSDAADLANSHTANLLDSQSDTVQVIDCYRSPFRYLTPVVNRGTANAEVLGVLVVLYNGESMPPLTQPTSLASPAVFLVNPSAGTA